MGKARLGTVVVFALFLVLVLGLIFRSEDDLEESRLPLAESVYVWNRVYGDGVRKSLALADSRFVGLSVLAGEIETNREGTWVSSSQFVALDWSYFSRLRLPLTLCFRLQSWRGPFETNDEALIALTAMVERVLREAIAEGVRIDGVQIDFDCSTSKLSGYARWLGYLKTRMRGLDFSITVLPDWLRSRSFSNLVGACDYYVLQVHSLIRPKSVADEFSLFDSASAKRWVLEAEEIGVPYQVALPTYSYELGFDEAGDFVGLSAEGGGRVDVASRRIVRSDPVELAAAKVSLSSLALDSCVGLIWFRLPVSSDTFNWDWSTFDAVRANTLDDLPVLVELMFREPHLAYIELRNSSNQKQPLPPRVVIPYSEVGFVAWDSLRYYVPRDVVERREIVFERIVEAGDYNFRPGEKLAIGWVRLSDVNEIKPRMEYEEDR